jgi:hypothetical protein
VRFARLFTGMLALAGLFLLSGADSAWAVDYIFAQQNPVERARTTIYPWNAVSQYWAFGPYDTTWSNDGTFTPELQQAIQSWQSAVPQLTFVQGAPYNLYFLAGPCPEGAACIGLRMGYVDDARQAVYWVSSEIRVVSPQVWTATGRADLLRHEIGHWVGLDEQYIERPNPACSSVPSVMNAAKAPNAENCLGIHAPTSWDIDKATRFWKGDNLESPALGFAGSSLSLVWTDAMWTKVWHGYVLDYWDSLLGAFVPLDSTSSYSSGIGFHKESIARPMSQTWDLTARGWPRGAWYRASVQGWSWAFETWSPAVYTILYVP